MSIESMEEGRFAELADSYGSTIERWPASERDAARRLLQQSPGARALLEAAAGLDRLLERAPHPPPPSPALRRRILEAAPDGPRPGLAALLAGLWDELGGLRRAGPVLACGLALGVVLAPLAAPRDSVDPDEALVNIVLTDVEHEEWLL